MRAGWIALGLYAVAAWGWGCSSSTTIDPDAGSVDAGSDAGGPLRIDAGQDAGQDAGFDAGFDADLDSCVIGEEWCNGDDDDCDGLVDEAPAAEHCALPSATARCEAAACLIEACLGYHADCDGDPANGCEIDLTTDHDRCGTCAHTCATGETCADGLCDSERIVDVSSGSEHSCAVRTNGAVWCWGDNRAGQLGNGTTTSHDVPAPVLGIEDAVDVECGGDYTCALHATGHLSCWGDNGMGELGDGTTISTAVPVDVLLGGELVTSFAVGGVRCWGEDNGGGLGDGRPWEYLPQPTPVDVVGITDAVAVGVWVGTSCAVLRTGVVECWGDNYYGLLGDGSSDRSRLIPGPVSSLTRAVALASKAIASHAAVLDDTGTLWTWGLNGSGELGDGTTTASGVPVRALGLDGVTVRSVGVGVGSTWISLDTGRVLHVGLHFFDGDGATTSWTEAPAIREAARVVPGGRGACVLHMHGSVSCAEVPLPTRAVPVIGLPPLGP